MAGIGFTLRKMTNRGDLWGIMQAYSYSAILSSGPWLFTILALVGITFLARYLVSWDDLLLFRTIITYNFSFSLVFCGPIVMVGTRLLADQIHEDTLHRAPSLLFSMMLAYVLVVSAPMIWLYGYATDMTPAQRAAAIAGGYLIGLIWTVVVFVSALKNYAFVSAIFFAGMVLAVFACGYLLGDYGATGLMWGFNAGLALILFGLLGWIFVEYPALAQDLAFLPREGQRYWILAISGLCYNIAIWVDKWVMWLRDGNVDIVAGILRTAPYYDSAMFLSYLFTIPIFAVFFVNIETSFFEKYNRFYKSFQKHATYMTIDSYQREIVNFTLLSLRNLAVLTGLLAILIVLSAPFILETMNIPFKEIGVFRFGALGACLHVLAMFAMVFLSYFDFRKPVMLLNIIFMVANCTFTWLTADHFVLHGMGYFLASALTFSLAMILLVHNLKRLAYGAFVTNNPSV
ncbi:exopolysaccharide Pel transporter PelG [Thalassospira sp. TSL5-1]|uniref:exopolysaccharide Pel transporter PelG n=1 Tax=Thalassospira sp. TSL5-1 TaxID=1544451 RepID=UPI00093BED2E|nr:exopolysaccharide Pel transporter PelG [Thalassospira sp. TSL5-1]OKH86264.1 hypothetical protein LF95_23570 [Thalassospira sp. TSL5-1]